MKFFFNFFNFISKNLLNFFSKNLINLFFKNIFKSMCDKTAVFDDDSDGFDECDVLNTESPTRIFNMSLVNFIIFK